MNVEDGGFNLDLSQEWGYYYSKGPDGAYRFVPNTPTQKPKMLTPKGEPKVFQTDVMSEVHVGFEEPWVKQVTRILRGQPYIEVEYTVGPVPISDGFGKNVITRYTTPIQSDKTFYTDANGREFMKRVHNFRPTWNITERYPVAGNYYPVNAATYIEDDAASLSVVLDRSQGGASLIDGSIELMVQRRLLLDDYMGVGEALNETDGGMAPYPPFGNKKRIGDGVIIKGKHRILIGGGRVGASLARSQMDEAFSEPVVFMSSSPLDQPPGNFHKIPMSALQSALPENVMIVTFSLLHDAPEKTFLVRLAHQHGKDENEELSQPVMIDMGRLLIDYELVSMAEKTLTGNRDYSEWTQNRISWTVSPDTGWDTAHDRFNDNGFLIKLNPLEIRTFELLVRATENPHSAPAASPDPPPPETSPPSSSLESTPSPDTPPPETSPPSSSSESTPSSGRPPLDSTPQSSPTSLTDGPTEGAPSESGSSTFTPPIVAALLTCVLICALCYCRKRRGDRVPVPNGSPRSDYSNVFNTEAELT